MSTFHDDDGTERDVEGGGVRLTATLKRMTSLPESLTTTVHEWIDSVVKGRAADCRSGPRGGGAAVG